MRSSSFRIIEKAYLAPLGSSAHNHDPEETVIARNEAPTESFGSDHDYNRNHHHSGPVEWKNC